MSKQFEININRFDGGMSNDPRLQDSDQCDFVAHFDIFDQPKRLKPVRSLVADTNDGSTSTGMKQYHVQSFGIVNAVNNIYGLGTKSDGTGYKLFKKTDITGNWSIPSGTLMEGTDTMWPGVLQPSVGSNQHLHFFAGDKLRTMNYNSGTEYVHPSNDFTDTTTSVCEGVVAKDQNSYLGRNNSILRVTAPGASQVFTVTIASPGVFTSTAHGLLSGSRVRFTTTGALPTGIVAGTEYFVISTGLTADAFQISATLGGSAINTTGSQSGVHTLYKPATVASQLSIPATHEISSIDTYGNYLAFSARPKAAIIDSSTKSVVTGADSNAVGTVAWSNPTNIASSDNTYASAQVGGGMEVLVVAGGGPGGFSTNNTRSGAGGAGGVIHDSAFQVAAGSYPVVVGAGGTGAASHGVLGSNGENSSFSSYTAIGGGAGGNGNAGNGSTAKNGANGGSGGGGGRGSSSGTGGAGTSGQGSAGGDAGTSANPGGGGGAGGAGGAGTAGAGVAYTISGSSVTYAEGGGNNTGLTGGNNTGTGGGGLTNGQGPAGGSGVVIIRYLTSAYGTCTGGTITTDGLYTVHTFTTSGTFTVAAIGTVTHYLKGTNFGFNIPSGSTINGIKVDVEKKASGSTGVVTDTTVKIIKADGNLGSTNKALPDAWSFTEGYVSYGGSLDLWGETWAYTDINDSDFGIAISATLQDSSAASVDHIRITVYYTAAPPSFPNLSSYLYIWDLVSADVQETIDMGPGKLSLISNVGGIILGVTDEYISDAFGNDKGKIVIRGWSGGEAQILKTLPALASGGTLAKWKAIRGGHIYFYAKIPNDVNASTYREGIWAFGRKDAQSPWALSLEVDTSQFASSVQGYRFVGNFLMVAHSTDGSLSRSSDTETYTYTSIYQSQVYENDYESQLTAVELTTEPLPTGASATVLIRQNEETAWTTLFTMNTTSATYDLRSRLASGEDFAKFHTCQFRIESTGGAVPVKLRARYISLSEEADE